MFVGELLPIAVLRLKQRCCRQADFVFSVFREAEEGLHRCCVEFLNVHHLLEAKNREVSHEDVAKSAIHGCGGNLHFLEKSESCFVEFDGRAVEVLLFFKERS